MWCTTVSLGACAAETMCSAETSSAVDVVRPYIPETMHPVYEDGSWLVVEEWLPAVLLDPA